MAPPSLEELLASFNTVAASHTELQDSVEIVAQLVEALTAAELHYPTLHSLSPSLPASLTSLLLVLPSSLLPLLGAFITHTHTNRLCFLLSDDLKTSSRFGAEKGKQRAGEAVERALEGVLRGIKGYVDDSGREEKISKKDRDLVGEYCFGPLIALLALSKLRMALKRKVLDIIDYSISHHPSNKARLLDPSLLGAEGLGRILADSEDYGLTERALELGWRLKDGVGGKEKKAEWDELLWKALGEGKQEEEIRRKWKGVKKTTYLDDAADILAFLGARDLTRFQNIHALTLTANSHAFIENPSAPRSASYDQSVSFDRVSFTATTTRELGEDDVVQQDLELELDSVERVLVGQEGDGLSVRIVSFHPPTLDSAPLPLSIKSKDKEHHISFTMRAEDGPKLAEVLDARELLWETSVSLTAFAEHGSSLPTPKKTPSLAPSRTKPAGTDDTTSKSPAVATKTKSNTKTTAAQEKAKETAPKPQPAESKKSKEVKSKAPTKPLLDLPPSSQHPSKLSKPVTAPLGAAPVAERPSAPPPGKTRFSHVSVPLPKTTAGGKRKPKGQGEAKGGEVAVVGVGEGRAQKRKAGDEPEGAVAEVKAAEKKEEARKKQRVSEQMEGADQGGRKSKSVAFEQRSPTAKRLSTTTSLLSPSRNFGARSPHRSPAKASPYHQIFSRADDSGYGGFAEDGQQGPEKMDVDLGGGIAEPEDEEEEEDEEFGEMLSQMMEGRPKREVRKLLERLQKYGAEELRAEMEDSGGENGPDFEAPPLPAVVNSPPTRYRNQFNAVASPMVVVSPPRADIETEQQRQALHSPFGSLRKRIAFGQGEAAPSKAKKSKRASKKEKVSVGGAARARRDDNRQMDEHGRDKRRGEMQQWKEGGEDLIIAERDQKAHDEIGRTLMALSAIVLDNFQQGRIKANGKFGASKARIGDKAYRLGMHLHQSTTAVSSPTRDEVLKLKGMTGRMQQLSARSRAFGEGLTKEMNA